MIQSHHPARGPPHGCASAHLPTHEAARHQPPSVWNGDGPPARPTRHPPLARVGGMPLEALFPMKRHARRSVGHGAFFVLAPGHEGLGAFSISQGESML